MAPRGTLQEGPPAAGVPLTPAAAAPHHARPGIADEAHGGAHTTDGFEAPPKVAPLPGAGDPPPRHHVAPGPVGGGGADYSYLPPGFVTVDTSEGCQCWQTHDDSLTPEEECRCRGRHITQLPANLSASMDRLSLTKIGLRTLGHRNLSLYAPSIKELILRDVFELRGLESDVFWNMTQLKTIYISHAPRLVKLPSNVFHVFLPSLKVLRIVHTGLTVLPGLSQLHLNRGILHLLDLENNKIRRITTSSVSIRAIQLLLDNNNLKAIEASAFKGSEIDKLSLKGNTDLTDLHLLAFQGVKSLSSLDLSNTRISRLPTEGLESLESLHLTGTYELKVFPSVYSFKHITWANLTYPYHCCAFRYPRLHDPTEHRKHEEFLKRMEKVYCGDVTSPLPKTSPENAGWRRRRRRAVPASTHTPEIERTKGRGGGGGGEVSVSTSSPSPGYTPSTPVRTSVRPGNTHNPETTKERGRERGGSGGGGGKQITVKASSPTPDYTPATPVTNSGNTPEIKWTKERGGGGGGGQVTVTASSPTSDSTPSTPVHTSVTKPEIQRTKGRGRGEQIIVSNSSPPPDSTPSTSVTKPGYTPSTPVTKPGTKPEIQRTKEQERERDGIQVPARASSDQLERRHLRTSEERTVDLKTIPRPVTSASPPSPPPPTSFSPSLRPPAPPKDTPHTSRLSPAPSVHFKAQKRRTKAVIMSSQEEKKEDEEEVEEGEDEEGKVLEWREVRREGINKESGSGKQEEVEEEEGEEGKVQEWRKIRKGTGKQVEDVEENLPYPHSHPPPHLPHDLPPHLPPRLPRSSLPQDNTSTPNPHPHPRPQEETHAWGASLTHTASSPQRPNSGDLQDPHAIPRADEGLPGPGTSEDINEHPEVPLGHSFHPYPIPGAAVEDLGPGTSVDTSEAPEKPLGHSFHPYPILGALEEDLGSETSVDPHEAPEKPLGHSFHPYPIPGALEEDLGSGTSEDLNEHPEVPLGHDYHPYHAGGFADGGPEFDDQAHHEYVPGGGGFGEVLVDHGETHKYQDLDQFFHIEEVTVSPEKTVCWGNLSKNYRDVRCFPEPDAFNPCEDIMGNLGLRVAVWVVVVTAVFGNLAVMIVLMSTRFKMTVSKFLMCNLAVADLCMGVYLLIIAAMDLHTIGVYFNSAIYWQNGPGCKVAGFLTVFASELSILTLTVITLERWYAITYAIHLNKRLRLSVAVRVMVLAWIYALTMAALPLVGVSGYSKTSICLPMETADGADQAYLLILLITNGLAFVLICVCYAKMYCSIAGNNLAANTSDTTVAKRMALLVFTDFACWAPIAFFGLTAVCGFPLISVTHAKFLLVFFYPLNSCANPYLYAILTKQYRRDLFLMLSRHGFFTRRAMKYKGGCSTNTWLNHHHVCVSGGGGGGAGGSGGPSRRISTLTQITTCGEWRARTRDGSEESLPRQASPPRVRSISAELTVPLPGPPLGCGLGGGADRRPSDVCRRLQPVAEVHDGRGSPQAASPKGTSPQAASPPTSAAATSGSPHPIKNCHARMSFTPEQEALLQRYATDRQHAAAPAARRRPSVTDAGDEPVPLTVYTPTTPDTITTPVSPSLDHAV